MVEHSRGWRHTTRALRLFGWSKISNNFWWKLRIGSAPVRQKKQREENLFFPIVVQRSLQLCYRLQLWRKVLTAQVEPRSRKRPNSKCTTQKKGCGLDWGKEALDEAWMFVLHQQKDRLHQEKDGKWCEQDSGALFCTHTKVKLWRPKRTRASTRTEQVLAGAATYDRNDLEGASGHVPWRHKVWLGMMLLDRHTNVPKRWPGEASGRPLCPFRGQGWCLWTETLTRAKRIVQVLHRDVCIEAERCMQEYAPKQAHRCTKRLVQEMHQDVCIESQRLG